METHIIVTELSILCILGSIVGLLFDRKYLFRILASLLVFVGLWLSIAPEGARRRDPLPNMQVEFIHLLGILSSGAVVIGTGVLFGLLTRIVLNFVRRRC